MSKKLIPADLPVFIDRTWTPANEEQAENRFHRASYKTVVIDSITSVAQDWLTYDEFVRRWTGNSTDINMILIDGVWVNAKSHNKAD